MPDSAPVLEPAARAFVEATANPPFLFEATPEDGRKLVDEAQSDVVPLLDATVDELSLPGGPAVRIVRPASSSGPLPAILYIHGAGWVFGSALTHDRLVRELATQANAAVVFIEYSLSPEARYPTAIEECYTALQWIASSGADHELDPTRIAIAGDSVGGNMSAAVTIMAKQRRGPQIAAQLLYYPVTDASFDTESYETFATGYWLRRDAMTWFWDQYIVDPAQRSEITASPLRATTEDLTGLPPALVIVAEADVLRDEGEAYAAQLRSAGVAVTTVRYAGAIHDFVMLNALRDTNAAIAATAQGGAFLHHWLHRP